MGYSPWGRKESGPTEQLTLIKYIYIYILKTPQIIGSYISSALDSPKPSALFP